MITLDFDPLGLVIEVARELYPDAQASVVWRSGVDDGDGEPACGCTLWPDDGGDPIIAIDVGLPVAGAAEVLAHEIAHVVAGHDAGHGSAWEAVFDALHRRYCERAGGGG